MGTRPKMDGAGCVEINHNMDQESKVMEEVMELKKDVTCFIDETRDLENRGCQANLRLTGCPQGDKEENT